jgi:hypothetical protein
VRGLRRTLPRLVAALVIGLLGALWQRTRGDADAAGTSRGAGTPTVEARGSQPATVPGVGPDARVGAPADASIRNAGVGFKSRQRLIEHFDKHGAEFPGYSMAQYLAAAQALRDRPAGGAVLEAVRSDGVITRFDKDQGAFLAVERSGHIRTFFRPNDGEAYFRRQMRRRPESSR